MTPSTKPIGPRSTTREGSFLPRRSTPSGGEFRSGAKAVGSATVALLAASSIVALPADTAHAASAASPQPASTAAPKVSEQRAAFVSTPAVPAAASLSRGTSSRALRAGRAAPASVPTTAVMPVRGEVAVVGASWRRGTGAQTRLEYRLRTAGTWGAWTVAGHGDCPACTTQEETGPTSRDGSAAISVVGAQAVQARLVTPRGTAARDARFSVVDPGVAAADRSAAAPGGVPGLDTPVLGGEASAAAARLTGGVAASAPAAMKAASSARWVRSRASWGAKRTKTNGRFRPIAVAVHHTDGTNNYTRAQVPAILRGIQAFHRLDRGWNDIGYNALVDRYGRIWEGRSGGLDRPTVGAHATGFNDRLVGISVLGDFDRTRPPLAATRSVAWAAGRVARNFGFNPSSRITLNGARRYRLVGHRNVGQTTCPGQYLYNRLPAIRKLATEFATG